MNKTFLYHHRNDDVIYKIVDLIVFPFPAPATPRLMSQSVHRVRTPADNRDKPGDLLPHVGWGEW